MTPKHVPAGSKHLGKWAPEKPYVIVLLGTQAARAVSACHDLLEQNRLKRGSIYGLPEPDDSAWFHYCRSQRQLRRGLMESLGCSRDEAKCLDGVFATLSWFGNADRDVVQKQVHESLDGISAETFKLHCQELLQAFVQDVDSFETLDDSRFQEEILRHPAMTFFLQVAAPAFLRFGMWPSQLLRAATRTSMPDLEALDQLVRTDRRIARHPLVKRAMFNAPKAVAKEYARVIKLALARRPQKIGRSTLLLRIMGLISELSARMGSPIEARELREVFDMQALAEFDHLREFEVPVLPESLRRQVHRSRKHWLRSLPAVGDLEHLKSVRTLLDRTFYHFGHEHARDFNF